MNTNNICKNIQSITGVWMIKENRMRNCKRIVFLVIVIVSVCSMFILCTRVFFKEQIIALFRYYVCSKVVKQEALLTEVLEELDGSGMSRYWISQWESEQEDQIWYREMNNEKISEVFSEFGLGYIRGETEYVAFGMIDITRYTAILVSNTNEILHYGFYYNPTDLPIDAWTGEVCEAEFDEDYWLMGRHYRTEKVMDQWWYYEEKWYYVQQNGRWNRPL